MWWCLQQITVCKIRNIPIADMETLVSLSPALSVEAILCTFEGTPLWSLVGGALQVTNCTASLLTNQLGNTVKTQEIDGLKLQLCSLLSIPRCWSPSTSIILISTFAKWLMYL